AVFKPGLQVRPSGCRNANCTVIWDGEEPLQMDRMVVDFQLREDLTWSDGTRVTAGDSVFSFELANAPEAPGLRWAEDRSESYQALDTRTIQWTGRPGFTTAEISKFFWNPLPAHLIDGIVDWAELVNSDALAFSPLSYGPFMMMARELDRIAFVPNPNYYGTAEGLPLLDELVFRQIEGDRTSAVQALRSGECDVLDASFGWENDLELLEEVISEEIVEFQMESGEAWWQLVFGIMPAEYDDSYNPNLGDRPNFFGDPAVRQALVACLDREAMRENSLGEWVPLWPSFLPPEGSHLEQDAGIRFDPEQGRANLEEVGWLDTNADSEIPRIAVNVPDVPQGSEFRLELLVDETGFQQDMAAIIQNSLTACGIGVDIRTLSNDELYAPGSEGPLFGRHFDLALIAWDAGPELDCRLYMDQAIPDQASQWVGTNIAGFAQPDYDRDCAEAGLALDENRKTLIREAEHSFLNQLPAIPLFSIPRFWLVSSSVCGSDILTQSKGNLNMIEFIMDDRNCP
ncbi:MAG: ABC transporter substrate-binding protein, partial [Brevefilum sp.]